MQMRTGADRLRHTLGFEVLGLMISIPLSLAISLSALYFTGFSLHQLSIAGFVLALGLLVDDSIVVVENIARYLRAGYSRVEAAIAATDQIALAAPLQILLLQHLEVLLQMKVSQVLQLKLKII